MNSSPIDEVSIQVNSDRPVAPSGEASQVSSWTTTRIEHSRRGLEERCEGGEGPATAEALKAAKASGSSE